jgi:DNA-binding GntR family transcriptional regulator
MNSLLVKPAIVKDIDQQIYDKIYRAIIEQRILPGTKLGEEALSTTFEVSRSRIRRVLLLLSNRNVVELRPNKGAYVATPEPQETRHVFEARRSIEGTIVSRVVERITDKGIRKLQEIIREESIHLKSGNRHQAIRLSGEFHLLLAEIAGNHVLHRFLEELVSRTSLIIGMFGTSTNLDNSEDEHTKILEAIISHDSSTAIELMEAHLHQIEVSIRLPEKKKAKIDFQELFASV